MCGIAFLRLRKPLAYYQEKYGTSLYGINKLYLLMEKQHNRGQDGAGVASIKIEVEPGIEYLTRYRSVKQRAIEHIFGRVGKQVEKLRARHPEKARDPEWLKRHLPLLGDVYLGHLRYGTHGVNSLNTCHPRVRENNWRSRSLAVAGNFNMTNVEELFDKLTALGQHPRQTGDTITVLEKIGHFLDEENQLTFERYKQEGYPNGQISSLIETTLDLPRVLRRACKDFDGGYALAGLTGYGAGFVVRDPQGIRPAYYYLDDEVVVVCSEKPAIKTAFGVAYDQIRELTPGAALIVEKDGTPREVAILPPAPVPRACSFERVYFSRGNDPAIYAERQEMGRLLCAPILEAIGYDLANTIFSYIPNTAETSWLGLMKGLETHLRERRLADASLPAAASSQLLPAALASSPSFGVGRGAGEEGREQDLTRIGARPVPASGLAWATGDADIVKHTLAYAREMRKAPTPAEAVIWEELRDRRQAGCKFRRQHPIAQFIVDFVCLEQSLVIEVDGSSHDHAAQIAYDKARTAELELRGFYVLRLRNEEVLRDLPAALHRVNAALQGERACRQGGLSSPQPPSEGGGLSAPAPTAASEGNPPPATPSSSPSFGGGLSAPAPAAASEGGGLSAPAPAAASEGPSPPATPSSSPSFGGGRGEDSDPTRRPENSETDARYLRPRAEKLVIKDAKLRTFITDHAHRDDLVSHVYDTTYGVVRPGVDRVVVLDDSIVRGTTLERSIVRLLDRLQPREILIVSCAPQIRYPDCYGIDMSNLREFVAFRAMLALLKKTDQLALLDTAYAQCQAAEAAFQAQATPHPRNYVTDLYAPFTPEEIGAEVARLVTAPDVQATVRVIFQSIDDLHAACPHHHGDWYFTGHYPTPGGTRVVNRAFLNFYENKTGRAY